MFFDSYHSHPSTGECPQCQPVILYAEVSTVGTFLPVLPSTDSSSALSRLSNSGPSSIPSTDIWVYMLPSHDRFQPCEIVFVAAGAKFTCTAHLSAWDHGACYHITMQTASLANNVYRRLSFTAHVRRSSPIRPSVRFLPDRTTICE